MFQCILMVKPKFAKKPRNGRDADTVRIPDRACHGWRNAVPKRWCQRPPPPDTFSLAGIRPRMGGQPELIGETGRFAVSGANEGKWFARCQAIANQRYERPAL